MINFASLSRAAALAGLLAVSGAAPALAAPADVALLQSYIGEWRGRGVLIGANTETVVCRAPPRWQACWPYRAPRHSPI